jgi:hypothetical protein
MKRKNGTEVAHRVTAKENRKGKVPASAIFDSQDAADHLGSAGTETTSEFGLKSTVEVSKDIVDIPVKQTVDTVSSRSITNISPSVMMSDGTPDVETLNDRNQALSHGPYPVAPMDIDQPQFESGAEVIASPQMVEQPSGDAPSAVPITSTKFDSGTVEDVEMSPAEATNSGLATSDGAVLEQSMATNTNVDSALANCQTNENLSTADNHIKDKTLTYQEPLSVSCSHFLGLFSARTDVVPVEVDDLSGKQLIVNEV